ncbi:MAG: hypothetical protein KME20_14160, partial [Kaiparowitsia implicata GSE-PSE-MK54-09C]|nr:hypothetical protein [Kaiparowitsia implicata GSE-PSE-MK54-09C]
MLRIQYFERNPQPFFQHFTRCRTQVALVSFLNTCCFGEVTGLSFIDSTSIAVCHVNRAKAHQTFKG